jgi:hypothetical protein
LRLWLLSAADGRGRGSSLKWRAESGESKEFFKNKCQKRVLALDLSFSQVDFLVLLKRVALNSVCRGRDFSPGLPITDPDVCRDVSSETWNSTESLNEATIPGSNDALSFIYPRDCLINVNLFFGDNCAKAACWRGAPHPDR